MGILGEAVARNAFSKGKMAHSEQKKLLAAGRTAIVVLGADSVTYKSISGFIAALGVDRAKSAQSAEKSAISTLNDCIIHSAGAAMESWMPFNEDWLRSPKLAEYIKKAERVLATEFEESYLMLLEDPKMARLLPFWNIAFQNLEIAPHYVVLAQEPTSLASGLASRYSCDARKAYLIWLRTMLDAEYHSRGYSRTFIDPARVGDQPAQLLAKVAKQLGLVFPRNIQWVYSSSDPSLKALRLQALLRSQTANFGDDEHPVPPDWVKVADLTLADWATGGEASEGRDLLDAIREAFDDAAPAFNGIGGVPGDLAQRAHTLEKKLEELKRDLGLARAEIRDARANEVAAQQRAELRDTESRRERSEAASRIAHLESELAQRKAEVDDGEGALQESRKEIDMLREALRQAAYAKGEAEAQVRERYAEIVTLTRKLATEAAAVERFKSRNERLKLIALSFEDAGARGRLGDLLGRVMPWRWQVARIRKQMENKGAFDGAAYLAANPDVAEAGMDPLKHFLRHGLDENRPLGLN